MSDPKTKPEELEEETEVSEEIEDSQDVDYTALSDSFNTEDDGEEIDPSADESEAEVAEPEEEPEEESTTEAEAEAEPEPEGEKEEPAAEAKVEELPKEPEPEEKPGKTPAEQRERWIADLESHFSLTEDEATEIAITPEKAVPRLMAKMAVKISEMMVPALATTMPQIVEAQSSIRAQQQKAEEQFFTRWPQLREHRERVTRIAEVHRRLNPTAKMDEFIDEVGAQAIVALKLSPQVAETKPNGRPGLKPKARGTVPTTSSQGTRSGGNQFEQFAMELIDDD